MPPPMAPYAPYATTKLLKPCRGCMRLIQPLVGVFFTPMVGCFSLCEDHAHVFHVPPERLTDGRPCLDCFQLAREGLLREGTSGIMQTGHGDYQLATRDGGILVSGTFIAMQSHPFNGRNFICPRCGRGCYRIYEAKGWACRTCHRLDYACRHRHRTIPGYNRLLFLRRRIGASPVPFSPIAPKPSGARRYWQIVREIRALEAGLVQHARRDVSDVLDRRKASR